MTVYAFVDLDDTLFNSERKAGADRSRIAALDRQGKPLSYQSASQERFLELLWREGVVLVPTTGRNVSAYRRVSLPLRADHAICSFGGTILGPDGAPEPRWHAMMLGEAEKAREGMEAILAALRYLTGALAQDMRFSIVSDAGIDLYVSVKHNQGDEAALGEVADWLRRDLPDGWHIHLNGNNLAFMPGFLGKAAAVRWFLANLPRSPALTLGVGDSFTDLPFMALCDFAITPTAHSQIFASLAGRVR